MYKSRYNPKSIFVTHRHKPDFDTILTIVLISVIVFIAAGTVYAFAAKRAGIGHQYRKSDPTPKQVINSSIKSNSRVSAFTDLGQIRTVTKSPDDAHTGTLIIVSPWFSYNSDDAVLLEELSQKAQQEKAVIINYFGQNTKDELLTKGEDAVKEEIRQKLNEQLILGKIQKVFFDQYMFFE